MYYIIFVINNFRCRGLVLLETYSAAYDQTALIASLPKFLTIEKEVTGDPAYSMYNLSLKEDWKTSKRYYTGNDRHGKDCERVMLCYSDFRWCIIFNSVLTYNVDGKNYWNLKKSTVWRKVPLIFAIDLLIFVSGLFLCMRFLWCLTLA